MAKILIVDDIAVNRMKIKLSLKEKEYHFLEASNGLEAIEIAKAQTPDIILMDAMMPVMDGFEATKIIRKIEEIQRIPILMITSLESKDDKIKALNCGVNDFINKSFDKSELKARCHSYIELANLNKNYILATKNIISNLPNKLKLFTRKFNPKKRKYIYVYKVKKGDNLLKIAKKFDITVSMIKDYNKLGKYLHINQKIFIPLSYRFVKYKVKKGDSILKIAKKFGIPYKKIIKFNNLNTSVIRVGQVLKIPQRI